MNLNPKQWLAIAVAVLSVFIASTAQLTDLVGPQATKLIVSLSSITVTILSSISAILSTQTSLVKDVQSMPGVEKITVNAQASPTLAGLAIAPENAKIEAAPGADNAVNQAAKG